MFGFTVMNRCLMHGFHTHDVVIGQCFHPRTNEDDMTWKCFPYYSPCVLGNHRLPVGSPPKWSVMQNGWLLYSWLQQTIERPGNWDATTLIKQHCNEHNMVKPHTFDSKSQRTEKNIMFVEPHFRISELIFCQQNHITSSSGTCYSDITRNLMRFKLDHFHVMTSSLCVWNLDHNQTWLWLASYPMQYWLAP